MLRKFHPDFKKRFKVLFFTGFVSFFALFAIILALDHFHFSALAEGLIVPFLLLALGYMVFMFWSMHAIKCPTCGGKTRLIKAVEESKYLAQCETCKTDWDIGIGIGD